MPFSFVRKITALAPGRDARGELHLPPSDRPITPSLATEAVGQLAAWSAMAAVDFARRPVAGIAGEVALLEDVTPGADLGLEIGIRRLDPESVAYDGRATLAGRTVLELRHAVGPMLPTADLDDPESLRRRLAILSAEGDPPLPEDCWPAVEPEPLAAGGARDEIRARLVVPVDAAFYDEHFPRRPVYPGTLLLDSGLGLAHGLAREAGARVTHVRSIKFRRFLEPGAVVMLETKVRKRAAEGAELWFEATEDGRRVATARLVTEPLS